GTLSEVLGTWFQEAFVEGTGVVRVDKLYSIDETVSGRKDVVCCDVKFDPFVFVVSDDITVTKCPFVSLDFEGGTILTQSVYPWLNVFDNIGKVLNNRSLPFIFASCVVYVDGIFTPEGGHLIQRHLYL